jgi:hypothetical protein
MANGSGSSLGSTVEEELRIARQLRFGGRIGLSQATLDFLKKHGHGKRGRPRKYHKDRPASGAERVKAYYWRQKALKELA